MGVSGFDNMSANSTLTFLIISTSKKSIRLLKYFEIDLMLE